MSDGGDRRSRTDSSSSSCIAGRGCQSKTRVQAKSVARTIDPARSERRSPYLFKVRTTQALVVAAQRDTQR